MLDAGKLSTWLSEIKDWLDANPNDVVTVLLVNSDDATASDLHSEFEAAGVNNYTYTPTSQTSAPSSWPTLQELISKGTRLMTFVASLDSNTVAPYLMDEFTFIWETPYNVDTPSNFSCLPDRPDSFKGNLKSALSSNQLPLMNHFLYESSILGIQTPNASYVSTTNAPSGGVGNLGTAADTCKAAYGSPPTFILVDFFDKGPAIRTVDNLNGITSPVGRKSLPSDSSETSSDSNGYKGLDDLVSSVKSGANPSAGEWVWAGGDWDGLGGGIPL